MIPFTNGMSRGTCPDCGAETWEYTGYVQKRFIEGGRLAPDSFAPTKMKCEECEKKTIVVHDQVECKL